MISLQRRLLIGISVSVLTIVTLLFWGGSRALREINTNYVQQRLEQDLEALLGGISFDTAGRPELKANRLTPVYSQPFSGHYYQLVESGSVALQSRSLWDETLTPQSLPPGERRFSRQTGPSDQSLLVLAGGFRKQGEVFSLMVAQDLSQLERDIGRFQLLLASGAALALLVTFFVLRMVIRNSLQPLEAVRDDVRDIGRGSATALREAVPVEVRPLVREFNRLLLLLSQRIERSRNAVGNLAHALKTPLSLVQATLNDADAPAADRRLALDQTRRIQQLMERELRRARIAGSGVAGRHFSPADDLPALIDTLQRVHADRHLRIDAGAWPDAAVPADREDMLELLGNLLDNACKWAAGRISLSAELITADAGPELMIRIADDGPGVDDEQRDRLMQRGSRIDESRAGHGLGLAIARDIAGLYHGRLALGRSATLGGLEVSVWLPQHAVADNGAD